APQAAITKLPMHVRHCGRNHSSFPGRHAVTRNQYTPLILDKGKPAERPGRKVKGRVCGRLAAERVMYRAVARLASGWPVAKPSRGRGLFVVEFRQLWRPLRVSRRGERNSTVRLFRLGL